MNSEAKWLVRLTCCGRDAGVLYAESWEEADALRDAYTSGPGVNPQGYSAPEHSEGHKRSGVIEANAATKEQQARGCSTCALNFVDSHRCDSCHGENNYKNWTPATKEQQA